MKRRFFLKNSIVSLVSLASLSSILLGSSKPLRSGTLAKANKIYHVKAGDVVTLPQGPNSGDCLYFVVDREAMAGSCRIKYSGEKILGFSEDLELDTMANFKMIYDPIVGWKLA